ncbi:MAG: T9SS type A sorting domain-containing protein [Ignavibacteriales bacterium]|nr:T9SS type A sorting domain-containing protein [Ignavibacteriales bacterium]
MKKLLTISLLLFLFYPVHAQLKWKITGTMPYPVYGGQVVYDIASLSNKIYILGGYSESLQREVDWIQEYDVFQNTWRIVGNMQQIRKDFVAGIWKNNIMYYGGVVETSTDKYSIESWDFKLTTSPAIVFDHKSNFGRSLSTGHILGDKFYIIGGDSLNAGSSSDFPYIVEYNLITKKDTGIAKINSSKDKPRQHMSFIVGDNIYIFGGVFNGVNRSIRKFNIPLRTFSDSTQKLIEARAGAAAVYNPISQKGFIIGGYNETNIALNSVEEVTILPDGSLNIVSSTPLNYSRTNLMAVNYKGTVAVFGGKDASGKVVPYVEISENITDVVSNLSMPNEFQLNQNYPNPFNPETVISYQLAKGSFVTLKVYDMIGREIETLVNEYQQSGVYNTRFSVLNSQLPSGIYFYRLTAGSYSLTKKMLLLK